MQMATIVQEVGDKSYSLVFDGTPYRCECFGIGIFFADDKEQVGNVPNFFVSDKLNIDGRLTHVQRRAGAVNDKLMSYIFLTCNRFSRYSPPPGSAESFLFVSEACWRTIWTQKISWAKYTRLSSKSSNWTRVDAAASWGFCQQTSCLQLAANFS